ncbi:complex I intermediate-associated protein 84, mitochondrial precursor [Pyrenophora tritici-repentis Pt-1C-BFP]|uniref:Complex I intermediate-associated protein 84, mitochondrial n=1 Tax=Pyrenophora tritici-repentis (strain Pt-1C-BFP) TaxID=426418 RepID=B2WNN4_PYRTR|nr:complex I intermediate-associated protein 84, mitochondrial precursor [Pyrenophora tritici-repentis Pt-1C-BFP]EDU44644.1 complex I intermediate-associated protein 84, mitochondrial precursor [Pyrenophora tritici-repentis Pt-1C-BFP]
MPSHLTRVVFRRIIANEPLLYRGCRYRALRPHIATQHGALPLSRMQRRTFFGNLFKQQRKLRPAEVPAGLQKMSEVLQAKANDTRPPKPTEIADAIKDFFAQRKGTFEDFHIGSAYGALLYLQENPKEDGQPWFSMKDLKGILEKLLAAGHQPKVLGEWHLAFGRLLIEELAKLEVQYNEQDDLSKKEIPFATYIKSKQVRLLSYFGATAEAREVAASGFKYDAKSSRYMRELVSKAWRNVLMGNIRESNLDEISKTMDASQAVSVPLTTTMQKELVSVYAENNHLDSAKFWYSQPVVNARGTAVKQPLGTTSAALLKACASAGDLTFGQQVVATMLKDEAPSKETWDATLLWSVAIGKGPDEVNRMIDVLIRRNDEARRKDPKVELIRPDTQTINALVEHCMSKQDPYAAERYIVLGEKRGILPDETTYTMQMQYRISVGDLDGARAAYFNLQGSFSGDERSVAAINLLIQALLLLKTKHVFDELMAMVDDLHEAQGQFRPPKPSQRLPYCIFAGYSPAQRRIIQKTLLTFILDGETSTSDAWDGYQMLRNVFAETPREERILIMKEFFARNRSDMACHVFFHMRNHVSPAHNANKDVYVAAFVGFARCADAESLELAHNQLKLDLNVDMDTKLRNSLMLAYAATGENRKALRFWRDICESKEGPTYNSIAIAFRSCEGMHFGSEHAKSIWERLKEQDIEIDKTIWTAYMSAVARNHNHDEARELMENVEEEYGFTPDLHILGSWFNCTANSNKQEDVEAWIRQRYPEVWSQMEALGHWVTMDGFGYRQYNINRDLDP